jgi:hypothetical protein
MSQAPRSVATGPAMQTARDTTRTPNAACLTGARSIEGVEMGFKSFWLGAKSRYM